MGLWWSETLRWPFSSGPTRCYCSYMTICRLYKAENMQSGDSYHLAEKLRSQAVLLGSWSRASVACNVLTPQGNPNPRLAQMIANGYEPRNSRTRTRLGLAPHFAVVLVGEGAIPDGSQAIRALQCQCGQWFISNHPRRKHCFLCHPFRQRNEHSRGGKHANNARPITPF